MAHHTPPVSLTQIQVPSCSALLLDLMYWRKSSVSQMQFVQKGQNVPEHLKSGHEVRISDLCDRRFIARHPPRTQPSEQQACWLTRNPMLQRPRPNDQCAGEFGSFNRMCRLTNPIGIHSKHCPQHTGHPDCHHSERRTLCAAEPQGRLLVGKSGRTGG